MASVGSWLATVVRGMRGWREGMGTHWVEPSNAITRQIARGTAPVWRAWAPDAERAGEPEAGTAPAAGSTTPARPGRAA